MGAFAIALFVLVVTMPTSVFAQAGVGIDPGEINGLPPIEADTPTTVAVTVRNPGTEAAAYQMLAQPLNGEPELAIDPAWFSFEPATFDLDGGTAQEIQVTFTVPDGIDAGDYLALVTAQLVSGRTRIVGCASGCSRCHQAVLHGALGPGVVIVGRPDRRRHRCDRGRCSRRRVRRLAQVRHQTERESGSLTVGVPAALGPHRVRLLCVASLIGVAACGGGGDSSPVVSTPNEPAPSVTTEDEFRIDPGPLPTPADVADESVTAVVLASSGFEIDADLIEAAEQVEADLLAQATAAIGPQGFRRPDQGIATSGGMSVVGLLIDLVSRLTSQAQQPFSASLDSATSQTSGGTLTMGGKVSGDGAGSTSTELSFEAKVVNAEGRTVTERITGTVAGPLCPDEFGLLDLEVSGEMEVTGNGTERSRHTFKATASATFDENGEMAQIDIELNVQSDRTGADGRTAFVDVTYGVQFSNVFGGGESTTTKPDVVINRASQEVTSGAQQSDYDMVDNGQDAATKLVLMALASRRSSIQNNGCVAVVAEAPGTVGAKQVVPIDVKTRHVVEGAELDKRVEATLTGPGSIDPASLPTTPETINYTAGDKGGDTGTIALVSRSRRGIGTTNLTIKVGDEYRVDSPAGVLRLQGSVCALDAPFTLSVVGEINGTLTFTPSGTGGGTYDGSADLGRGSMTWSGGYTLTGMDTESRGVDADEGTTQLVGPIIQPVPGFWQGGPDFVLIPDATACP